MYRLCCKQMIGPFFIWFTWTLKTLHASCGPDLLPAETPDEVTITSAVSPCEADWRTSHPRVKTPNRRWRPSVVFVFVTDIVTPVFIKTLLYLQLHPIKHSWTCAGRFCTKGIFFNKIVSQCLAFTRTKTCKQTLYFLCELSDTLPSHVSLCLWLLLKKM